MYLYTDVYIYIIYIYRYVLHRIAIHISSIKPFASALDSHLSHQSDHRTPGLAGAVGEATTQRPARVAPPRASVVASPKRPWETWDFHGAKWWISEIVISSMVINGDEYWTNMKHIIGWTLWYMINGGYHEFIDIFRWNSMQPLGFLVGFQEYIKIPRPHGTINHTIIRI